MINVYQTQEQIWLIIRLKNCVTSIHIEHKDLSPKFEFIFLKGRNDRQFIINSIFFIRKNNFISLSIKIKQINFLGLLIKNIPASCSVIIRNILIL